MTAPVAEGTLLWEPSPELMRTSTMTRYMVWLSDHRQLRFDTYDALWQWSRARSALDQDGTSAIQR